MLLSEVGVTRGFRLSRAGAVVLGGTCLCLGVAGLVLHLLSGELPGGDYGAWWITNACGAIAIAIPGTLVAARRPGNPLGWLLLVLALAHGATAAGREYAFHALAPGSDLPGGTAALWISGWTWIDFPFLLPLVFLFPDGRTSSRRWTLVFGAGMLVALVATVWIATAPGPMLPTASPPSSNPLAWHALNRLLAPHDQTVLWVLAGTLGLGIVAMLARARGTTGPARRQIVLVALAAAILTVELAHEDYSSYAHEEFVGAAVLVLLAVAVAVAVLRYGLYEIDVVVSRSLTLVGLTIILASAYSALIVAASAVTHSRLLESIPAAIAVAILFAPVRGRLQRATDRLLFGNRDDPYAVISSLGESLDDADPGSVLPTLARSVAQTLKLSYVAIDLAGDFDQTSSVRLGRLAETPIAFPLIHAGRTIGILSLGPRAPGEPFTRQELRLFADIARQVAVAAHAVMLTADLQRSREQLIAAREEERRRLRRDLHDGLGPTLAGLSMQLASVRVMVSRDVEAADGLLERLIEQTQTATADVRRLVYALRPPVLDELGLVPALRVQAERFPGLEILVHAPQDLASLPAAVEVAAYRIATEALTNVSRHATATRCTITVTVNGHLELAISDDGIGMSSGWRPGVGVSSIRERAAELGGTCVIGAASGGGTRVLARLPLPSDE